MAVDGERRGRKFFERVTEEDFEPGQTEVSSLSIELVRHHEKRYYPQA
jgi:hypothetical protein